MAIVQYGHHKVLSTCSMATMQYGHHPIWPLCNMVTTQYGHYAIWPPCNMATIQYGQVQSVQHLVDGVQYDWIYHEHMSYD